MIRIYLALQEFEDGRVMFRRISPDIDGVPPGGAYQKQTLAAYMWFLEHAGAFPGAPVWPFDSIAKDVNGDVQPFEILP